MSLVCQGPLWSRYGPAISRQNKSPQVLVDGGDPRRQDASPGSRECRSTALGKVGAGRRGKVGGPKCLRFVDAIHFGLSTLTSSCQTPFLVSRSPWFKIRVELVKGSTVARDHTPGCSRADIVHRVAICT